MQKSLISPVPDGEVWASDGCSLARLSHTASSCGCRTQCRQLLQHERNHVCFNLILGFCQSCRVSKGCTWLKNFLHQWHFHEKLNVRNTDKISVHEYRFFQTLLMDLQQANSQSRTFGREWTRLLLNIIQSCFYFWLAFLGNFKAREISLSFPSTNMI